MSKHVSAGRARYSGRFCFVEFLSRALRDLAPHTDLSRIMLALVSDPKSVRGVIDEELSLADLQRDNGGFTRYCVLRQVEALVKKYPGFYAKTAEERKVAAMSKFDEAERRCRRANRRLSHFERHWSRAPFAEQVLNDARGIIHDVLGDFGPVTLQECFKRARFTTGASFDEKSTNDLSLYAKLERHGTITSDACPVLRSYLESSPELHRYLTEIGHKIKIVKGDRVSCVPKTWKTDRTIAVQPSWNVFLQKGVDEAMRLLLRRVGVDLRDQEANHVPACIGSVDGSNATIDLSSASDTISIAIVRRLIPQSWYEILDLLRCKFFTRDRGKTWEQYQKFSAMGNCFTFPVETIIFWAIAKACCAYTGSNLGMIRTYGDDLVVPREAALLLQEVLLYAGFEPNVTKSFCTGYFRETCGSDFLYGIDVRPVYIKTRPAKVQDVYSMYNRLLMNRLGFSFPETLEYLLSLVERAHRGPAYLPSGEDYYKWYAGKSTSHDVYFFAEPTDPKWDLEYMHQYWTYKTLKRVYDVNKSCRDETVWRCLLLGYATTARVSNAFRLVQFETRVSYWPTLSEALTENTRSLSKRINAWI